MKKLLFLTGAFFSLNTNASITVTGIMEPNEGCKVLKKCEIHAVHTISITNESSFSQPYHYYYQLCNDGMLGKCDFRENNVLVEAHQTWINSCRTGINPEMESYGLQNIQVKTGVGGYETRISDMIFKMNVRK